VAASLAFFDDRLNWAFVRELLHDEQAPVQWIFCSDGVKARLLAYGADHETEPSLLVRAAYVLHQPSSGAIHDDHFHVRIACSAEERARGCSDYGPIWPWLRDSIEKPEWTAGANDDDTLLTALLGDGEWDESIAASSAQQTPPATY
jgi:penicillin-insensitive murein endopeptidase